MSETAAKIVFAGTPEFARETLRQMLAAGVTPVLVLTQPDRPAGRGRQLKASPVKEFARQHGIPVWQPESLRDPDVLEKLRELEPDLMVVAAYGLILPQAALDIPKHGCVNVHASVLPRWRGAGPIQAAILAGDAETGVSLMQMTAGMDEGPVFRVETTPIGEQETAGELQERLASMGGELLLRCLPDILQGNCPAQAQDERYVTYAGKIRSDAAKLDWSSPAAELARQVRALNPAPGAWFGFNEERIKCWLAIPIEIGVLEEVPGTVVAASKTGIDVVCGENALRLLELQRPGRNRITAAEFAGQAPLPGRRFE